MHPFVAAAVVLLALTALVAGWWAWLDPAGFARFTNWPNHAHFLHDAGVFQIGIGLTMLLALWWRDGVAVVLTGFVFTNTFHAYNHAMDLDHGGHAYDAWALLAVSVVGGVALAVRVRRRERA
ncbi:hypothetical protein Actkin_03096 [Actinokineospora sp. UTMC 2448]|nr:hypothetical protein Actkin_03096 [Actinokineospora sp. UTMC 2448]